MRLRLLVISLSFLLWPVALCGQNIYLLSVGVADYPDTGMDLRLPVQDAMAIYRLYRTNRQARAVLLADANATVQGITEAAERLYANASEDDIVVFFFSGHGVREGFVAQDGCLSYDEVRRIFRDCSARSKMIFADACYAGGIREESGSLEGRTMLKDSNVMLFLSCRSNEVSFEREDMKNGIFTTCLIRCLKGGADVDRDRIITARELFDAVSRGVRTLSDDRQHPVMWGHFKDKMPVMVWK